MKFEWDNEKAAANERKHGVSFREASTVFGDPLAGTFPDPDHSHKEERWLTVGTSAEARLTCRCPYRARCNLSNHQRPSGDHP